jgi:hypothetical protein
LRLTPWLAIFALVVQFVAGFGHFHPDDFRGSAPGPGASLLVDTEGQTAQAPIDHAPGLPTHDDCAICTVMHLAASAALPVPLLLLAPATGTATTPPPVTRLRVAWPPHFLFNSRGPPLS